MELVEVSSRKGKRDLRTLDLLHSFMSVRPKDLDPSLRASCHSNLHLLDLNLLPDDGPQPAVESEPFAGSQSVCTIEKVKRALERVERESRGREKEEHRQRRRRRRVHREAAEDVCGSPAQSPSLSFSSSITTASTKRRAAVRQEGSDCCNSAGGSLVAAGCPSCLSYVLISKGNPRCPRCESQVPPPAALQKRPRIDLNYGLSPQ